MIYDLCIIGAGPAGLFAAIKAGEKGLSCILLEKMEKTGRKLRITGKGRCNITNTRGKDDFLSHMIHGRDFVQQAIISFSSTDTIRFIESLGVETIEERGGRVFPKSGKAWDVAQAMVDEVRRVGTTLKLNSRVTDIKKSGNIFTTITEKNHSFESYNVLLATGGASYPSTGSTGDGYALAWKLGHKIIPARPSLTHLEIKDKIEPVLLKNVNATIIVNGKITSSEFGEVEFNDRGLAGAAVISDSITAVDAVLDGKQVSISLDLKPALSIKQLTDRLERENTDSISAKELLRKFVPSQMIKPVSNRCGINIKEHISKDKYKALANTFKFLKFDVTGYGDFPYAITTAGGVSTDEINPMTMESMICSGLYFSGELIDIDAKTGGYNIQLALSTAALATLSINRND